MPPKKAAAAATTSTRPKRQVNGASKATDDAKPTKATSKAATSKSTPKTAATKATKASTKAAEPAVKAAIKKTTKRKATEEPEEEKPKINGVKRTKRDSATPAAATDHDSEVDSAPEPKTKKTTAATRKSPAPKTAARTARSKAVINNAPTTRLDVYVFGDGSMGELGLGSGKGCLSVKRPRLNPHLSADSVGVVQVSVGGMHTAVLTHDNKILTWGVNDQGALGRDTTWEGGLRDMDADQASDSDSDSDDEEKVNPRESTPGPVDLTNIPEGTVFTQLACADSATFVLTAEGLVYGCGTFRSNEGIFGLTPTIEVQRTLIPITGLSKITKLAAGANHVLALNTKGEIFAFGSGQQNQLGRRILERFLKNSLVPTRLGLPKSMTDIGAGAYHSFAMNKNHALYSWGLNSFGETGVNEFEEEGGADVHQPTVVDGLDNFGHITQIEGGSHHTIARTDKNEVLVWGRLDGFQLGLDIASLSEDVVVKDSRGHARILKVPTQVPGIEGHAIAAGSDHSIAISEQGKAWSWGFSTSYQTGLGTSDEVEIATVIDNTATRGKKLVWAGAGGQFSVVAGIAGEEVPQVNGTH